MNTDFAAALNLNLVQREKMLSGSDGNLRRMPSRKEVELNLLEAFDLIGGVPRMAVWANREENYGEFLKLWVKLAPKEGTYEVPAAVHYVSRVPASPLALNTKRQAQETEVIAEAELVIEGEDDGSEST